MTFNQMLYVSTIEKCMNFSEAAKLLYITQPALSRQIALVEEELGTKIFIRNNKAVSLTQAGEVLCSGIDEILNKYNTLIDEVHNINRTHSNKLCVGLVEMRPPLVVITDAVNQLIQSGYQVDVLSKSRVDLQEGLVSGNIDIIITHDDSLISELNGYSSIPLSTVQNCLVVPVSLPCAFYETNTLANFKDCEFLMIDEETKSYEKQFQISCEEAGFIPKIKYVDSPYDLVAMTSVGAGITCFPEDHYLRLLPNLKFLRLPEIVGSDIKAVWKQDSDNRCLKKFIHILRKNISENIL